MSFRRGQLGYFVAVAEEGQITRAAKRLHIAQPALSQAIAQLEAQLGLELLERHARGVSLTAAGEIFLVKAKAALRAEAEATATARSIARGAQGSIEMGFLSTPPRLFAESLFEEFARTHPLVNVSFRELRFPAGSTIEWLSDVDMALCFAPTPHPEVTTQALWLEPRWLLLHRSHPLAGCEAIATCEVIDELFYGSHASVDPVWAGVWTLDDHRGAPPERLTDDCPVNSLELIAAIASGRAVRAFTATTARALVTFLPELVAVPLSDAAPVPCALARLASVDSLAVAEFFKAARASVTPAG